MAAHLADAVGLLFHLRGLETRLVARGSVSYRDVSGIHAGAGVGAGDFAVRAAGGETRGAGPDAGLCSGGCSLVAQLFLPGLDVVLGQPCPRVRRAWSQPVEAGRIPRPHERSHRSAAPRLSASATARNRWARPRGCFRKSDTLRALQRHELPASSGFSKLRGEQRAADEFEKPDEAG